METSSVYSFSVNDGSGHIQAVSSQSDNSYTGTTTVDNCTVSTTYWWPQYWVPYTVADKTGTAFRIAQKLMEKKLVNPKGDVQKFVKLVNLIVDAL